MPKTIINKQLLDVALVLLNISNPYTIIPCLLFSCHTGVNSLIIFFITITYISFRFKGKLFFPKDLLFILFLVIFVYNIIVGILQGSFAFGFLGILFSNITFYLLLVNLYYDYRRNVGTEGALKIASKGYSYLCIYQLVIVAVMILVTEVFHLFNPLINDVSDKYDIFISNASRIHSGVTYYYPYNICLYAFEELPRLPFWHDHGVVTGVFHEPHTMTYYVIPFIFLSLFLYNNRKVILALFLLSIVYVIAAASTTNLICYATTLLLLLCVKYKKSIIVLLPLLIVGLPYLLIADNPFIDLIRFKMDSGSAEYSSSTLRFAFAPRTLFGSNFLDLSYLESSYSSQDVGWIVFLLNILFIVVLSYKTICLCLSTARSYRYVGFFALYFILHSSKLALRTYSLEFLMFVIFMVTYAYNDYKFRRRKLADSAVQTVADV